MKALATASLLLWLLAGGAAAQTSGPWQDCDGPTTHLAIDSDAMLPAIRPGQRILVTCFTHAIQGSSITAGQVRLGSLSPTLARGDLVAFHRTGDPAHIDIRRVIAVQDDRVQVREYRVLVNDVLMRTTEIGDAQVTDAAGSRVNAMRMHEAIARGFRGYDILIPADATYGNGTSEAIEVPRGFIFVLPDNRATTPNVLQQDLNLVPLVNLVGRIEDLK